MSMNMTKDIQEAIRKNMSAEVSGVLLDYMDQAENIKKELEVIKKERERKNEELVYSGRVVADLRMRLEDVEGQLKKLGEREDKIKNAELDIMKAEFERDKARAVCDATIRVVDTVFRNGQIKKNVFGNENLPYSSTQPGGYNNTGYNQQSYSKTETVEDVG